MADPIIYTPNFLAENRFKRQNLMQVRPKGWLIMDSWNNKAFPMDIFSIDTMQYNTDKLGDWFHQKYGGSKRDLFLPWHYIVELVNTKPYVIQTRPLMYKSNVPGFKNHYTIMIIGDGNQDIYPGSLYRQISHMIINPMKYMVGARIPNSKENFTLQIGKNFDLNKILKEMQ